MFLAQAGCPFQCVYCNQRAVTTRTSASSSGTDVMAQFRAQFTPLLEHAREQAVRGELAFYGGTFTALPRSILEEILETASRWVAAGVFSGLRFSTRPDAVTAEVCSWLTQYPVATVELGVQSLVDDVLLKSRRGYAGARVVAAAALIREQGWQLGLQLMLGLPGDSPPRFLDSVAGTLALRPDFVRIYPTLVLAGTVLAEWYRNGSYAPLSLAEAVSWCTPAYEACRQAQIPIARLGLHADAELQKPGAIVAGPYHPSFGYLVRVEWWKRRLDRCLEKLPGGTAGKQMTLWVAARSVSEVIGPDRSNVRHWLEKWQFTEVNVHGGAEQLPGEFDYLLN